jgi:hypothetical protein
MTKEMLSSLCSSLARLPGKSIRCIELQQIKLQRGGFKKINNISRLKLNRWI